MLALGAFPLYLLTKELLGNNKFGFVLAVTYLLYIPLQGVRIQRQLTGINLTRNLLSSESVHAAMSSKRDEEGTPIDFSTS